MKHDDTAKLARALWSEDGVNLPAAEFKARFDQIYARSEDIDTYWQLGGALNDYLGFDPHSFAVPPELATILLSSSLVDARIVGLKLLVRHSSNVDLITEWLCRALQSKRSGELYGGLYELGNLLDRIQSKQLTALLDVAEFVSILSELKSSRDAYVREWAQRYIDRLTNAESG